MVIHSHLNFSFTIGGVSIIFILFDVNRAHGYSSEDVQMVIESMAAQGKEPTFCIGMMLRWQYYRRSHICFMIISSKDFAQVSLSSPVLNEGELESLLTVPSLKPQMLPTFYDKRKGVDGSLEKTLNKLCEATDEAIRMVLNC